MLVRNRLRCAVNVLPRRYPPNRIKLAQAVGSSFISPPNFPPPSYLTQFSLTPLDVYTSVQLFDPTLLQLEARPNRKSANQTMGVFDTFRSAFGSTPPKNINTGSTAPFVDPTLNYFWRNQATGGQDISWSSKDGAWNYDACVTPRNATPRYITPFHSTPIPSTPVHSTPRHVTAAPSPQWYRWYDQNGVWHCSDGNGLHYTYGSAGWRDYSAAPTSHTPRCLPQASNSSFNFPFSNAGNVSPYPLRITNGTTNASPPHQTFATFGTPFISNWQAAPIQTVDPYGFLSPGTGVPIPYHFSRSSPSAIDNLHIFNPGVEPPRFL